MSWSFSRSVDPCEYCCDTNDVSSIVMVRELAAPYLVQRPLHVFFSMDRDRGDRHTNIARLECRLLLRHPQELDMT